MQSTGWRRWVVLGLLVSAQFMFVADVFVVVVALPMLRQQLAATQSQAAAVVAMYQIAYAGLLVAGGRLGDIHGRWRLFMAGLAGFTLASAACGLATTPGYLIVARVAQGASAAAMVPQVLAAIPLLFGEHERSRAFNLFAVALGLGGVAGLVGGGWLISANFWGYGWRLAFLINVPLGLMALAGAARLVPHFPADPKSSVDWPGLAQFLAGLVLLMCTLTIGGDLGSGWVIVGLLAAGVGLLWHFAARAGRCASAGRPSLLDLGLLRGDNPFRRGLIATCSLYAGISAFYFSVTIYLQSGLRYSPWQTGLAMTPLAFGFVIASVLTGKLSTVNRRRLQVAGCLVMAAGLLDALAVVRMSDLPTLAVLGAALGLYGVGQGTVTGSLISDVVASIRGASPGAASGLLLTTQQVAGATGVALIQKLITLLADPRYSGGNHGRTGFEAAAIALALLAVATSALVARAGKGTSAPIHVADAQHQA